MSHVGFGTLAVATAFQAAPLSVAIPVVVLAAVLILRIKGNGKIKGDAAIALISTTSLALWSHGDFHDDRNEYRCVQLYVRQYFGYERRRCSAECYFGGNRSRFVSSFYNKIFAVTFDETFAQATE